MTEQILSFEENEIIELSEMFYILGKENYPINEAFSIFKMMVEN